MKREFTVAIISGTLIVKDEAENIIAAGSPKRCADTLKEIFEDMKKSA